MPGIVLALRSDLGFTSALPRLYLGFTSALPRYYELTKYTRSWHCTGIVLALYWHCTGIAMPLYLRFGSIYGGDKARIMARIIRIGAVVYWHCTGIVRALYGHCTGIVLGITDRHCTCIVLALYLHCTGHCTCIVLGIVLALYYGITIAPLWPERASRSARGGWCAAATGRRVDNIVGADDGEGVGKLTSDVSMAMAMR